MTDDLGWPEPYTYIYSVYTVFLAGKSPNIWSYTAYIMYGLAAPTNDLPCRVGPHNARLSNHAVLISFCMDGHNMFRLVSICYYLICKYGHKERVARRHHQICPD
jgi:hypothetical protein